MKIMNTMKELAILDIAYDFEEMRERYLRFKLGEIDSALFHLTRDKLRGKIELLEAMGMIDFEKRMDLERLMRYKNRKEWTRENVKDIII